MPTTKQPQHQVTKSTNSKVVRCVMISSKSSFVRTEIGTTRTTRVVNGRLKEIRWVIGFAVRFGLLSKATLRREDRRFEGRRSKDVTNPRGAISTCLPTLSATSVGSGHKWPLVLPKGRETPEILEKCGMATTNGPKLRGRRERQVSLFHELVEGATTMAMRRQFC